MENHLPCPVFVLVAALLAAATACAAPVEVAGRVWDIPEGATLDGTIATFRVDGKERKSSAATTEVDLSPFIADGGVEWRIRACGTGVAEPPKPHLGLKAMLSFKEGGGAMKYPGPPGKTGDFGWYLMRHRAALTNGVDGMATFTVGLQQTTGEASFDLASFRVMSSKVEWPEDDPSLRCEYSEALESLPRMRGMMLPSRGMHEEDFIKMRDWGVTLLRSQMNRNWGARDSERDLADYDEWLEVKLDHLEKRVLPFAQKYGMKVVIDMHMPPGGKSYDHEMNMFYEPEFAEHYLECWRRIARRFKGSPALLAYDLVNEPHQSYHSEGGNGCADIQRKAAETIREIDPDILVIFEPRHSASPEGFKTFAAVPIKDAIYEVHVYQPFLYTHQGVNTNKPYVPTKWPDEEKGWDKGFLRKALEPVREFQLRHGARIYVGEFSCIAWAEGAEDYLRDCIGLFEEYGWDWTYHAFDEAPCWNIEMEADKPFDFRPAEDTPRKRALLDGFRSGTRTSTQSSHPTDSTKSGAPE